MQIIHTISSLATTSGGPSRSVPALCDHLASINGLHVALLTQQLPGEKIVRPVNPDVLLRTVPTKGCLQAKIGLGFRKQLGRMLATGRYHIVHAHGVWDATTYWSAMLARRYGAMFVLHPRGMLEAWCLQHKSLKKRMGMAAYAWRMLKNVQLFVATSDEERDSIRTLDLRQPVAVIPNGVRLPEKNRWNAHRSVHAPRQVLFLSRVHPQKGLPMLLQAWRRVMPQGWKLVLAGPDENGHWAEVCGLAKKLGLQDVVEYTGEVHEEQKERLFLQSDLFVLPSMSENFGIVVAEALAYGLPVITTKGAPWSGLERHRCGWWIDHDVESLANALREALALSDDKRKAMGLRGRRWMQKDHSWGSIARQMADAYRWLIEGGKTPACMKLD